MKNIESIMKFCSRLNDIFEYPYYFNWSAPTNHKDDSPEGEIRDVNYVIFRVGKYQNKQTKYINDVYIETDRNPPIEKQLFFGRVNLITKFIPFEFLLNEQDNSNIKINSFDELIQYKEELKIIFDKLLFDDKELNEISLDDIEKLKNSVYTLKYNLETNHYKIKYHYMIIKEITNINNVTEEILDELFNALFNPIK